MNGSSPPPNIIQNSLNSTPSTLSPISFEPRQSSRNPRQNRGTSDDSRRRINIQNQSARSVAPTGSESISIEEGKNDDPFESIIEEFDRLDLDEADGGDSDVEGAENEAIDETYVKAMIDRNSHESDIHVEEINSGNIAFAVADKGVIRDNDNVNLIEKVITIPDDWKLPNPKDTSGNKPTFEQLDNPGDWNNYIFRPVYKKMELAVMPNTLI